MTDDHTPQFGEITNSEILSKSCNATTGILSIGVGFLVVEIRYSGWAFYLVRR